MIVAIIAALLFELCAYHTDCDAADNLRRTPRYIIQAYGDDTEKDRDAPKAYQCGLYSVDNSIPFTIMMPTRAIKKSPAG